MAVSLKKPEKVSLEKTNVPPTVREYTPEHLIDEEEIIQRPRQPPIQPQHSNELKQFLEENGIDVTDDGDVRSKLEDKIKAYYRFLSLRFVLALIVLGVLVLIIVLVVKFTPHVSTSFENVPTENVSEVVTSASSSAESVPTGDFARVLGTFLELFRGTFSYISHSTICLAFIVLSGLLLLIRLVQNIFKMGRYK